MKHLKFLMIFMVLFMVSMSCDKVKEEEKVVVEAAEAFVDEVKVKLDSVKAEAAEKEEAATVREETPAVETTETAVGKEVISSIIIKSKGGKITTHIEDSILFITIE